MESSTGFVPISAAIFSFFFYILYCVYVVNSLQNPIKNKLNKKLNIHVFFLTMLQIQLPKILDPMRFFFLKHLTQQ